MKATPGAGIGVVSEAAQHKASAQKQHRQHATDAIHAPDEREALVGFRRVLEAFLECKSVAACAHLAHVAQVQPFLITLGVKTLSALEKEAAAAPIEPQDPLLRLGACGRELEQHEAAQ